MKKLILYFNTLRYLKWIQIRYQVIHRFRQIFFSVNAYKKFTGYTLYPVLHKYPPCVISEGLYSPKNHFCFLNLKKEFGENIDWNFPGYGKLWNYNLQYFDYLNDALLADEVKIKLIDHFSDGLINGKIKAEPFPISIRLVNWILFFSRTGYSSNHFRSALQLQAGYLEKNIEYHLLANHLLENYFTLAICGCCFRDPAMKRKYLDKIVQELAIQLSDDGAHIEGSPMYHCLILSRLLLLIDIAESNELEKNIIFTLRSKAISMLAWLDSFCDGNDNYPYFNDASDGIAAVPKKLFERALAMGLQWHPVKLKGSGYRRLNSNGLSLLIDVANIMPSYQPGHAHSDILHFTMEYHGAPVFVEAGTSTYENNQRRKYERSTAAHNTVVVNNTNQSQVWGSFRVARRASVTLLADETNLVSASHDGYLRDQGVIHSRSFSIGEKGEVIINDLLRVQKQVSTNAVALFHLHPSVSVTEITGEIMHLSNGLALVFKNSVKIETGIYQQANGLNKLIDAEKIIVHFAKTLTSVIRDASSII